MATLKKLNQLVDPTLAKLKGIDSSKAKSLADVVKGNGGSECKFAMTMLRGIYSPSEIAGWYKKYNCTDNHVLRLAMHCCSVMGWIGKTKED